MGEECARADDPTRSRASARFATCYMSLLTLTNRESDPSFWAAALHPFYKPPKPASAAELAREMAAAYGGHAQLKDKSRVVGIQCRYLGELTSKRCAGEMASLAEVLR